jgi:hypothetical protein
VKREKAVPVLIINRTKKILYFYRNTGYDPDNAIRRGLDADAAETPATACPLCRGKKRLRRPHRERSLERRLRNGVGGESEGKSFVKP